MVHSVQNDKRLFTIINKRDIFSHNIFLCRTVRTGPEVQVPTHQKCSTLKRKREHFKFTAKFLSYTIPYDLQKL